MASRHWNIEVASAGTRASGAPATEATIDIGRAHGVDLTPHRSRVLDPGALRAADLVVGMERAHVRETVVANPAGWPRTFTLKELVRRGEERGQRDPAEPLRVWLARMHEGRDSRAMLGASRDDDVADPTGSWVTDHAATARELDDLLARLVRLAWPEPGARRVPYLDLEV